MDITVDGLWKSFGGQPVLENVSHTFAAGKLHLLLGESGRGKTTLLRLLLGLEKPDRGQISGVPEAVGAVFQEDRLFPGLTVAGNLRAVLGRELPETAISDILNALNIGDCLHRRAQQLSGGQARRVSLARALLTKGSLLVLDEPFTGLDADNRRLAASVIQAYASGRTVLCVTHHPEDFTAFPEREIFVL